MKNETENRQLITNLLRCGVIFPIIFYVVAVTQMLTRPGFNITRHAISNLSNGDLGWIQITNFLLTGVLAILAAVGIFKLLRHKHSGLWGAFFIALFGIGFIIAGIFPPPAGFGFPEGAPQGMPDINSFNSKMHSNGFMIAFSSLMIACFIFAGRFKLLQKNGWFWYSLLTGIISPLVIVAGFITIPWGTGTFFALAGAIAFGWVGVLCNQLIKENRTSQNKRKEVN